MTTKTCNKCGETKSTDQFYNDRSRRDGLTSSCKTCSNARCRAYYEANREQISARVSAHYEANRDKIKAYNHARRALMGNPSTKRSQEVAARYATRVWDQWTPEEDHYVLTGPGTLIDKALQLSRTYEAVKRRSRQLRQEQTA